ncbi:hypothetical protein D3C77_579210 [compost metagenome]
MKQTVVSNLLKNALAHLFAGSLIAPYHSQVKVDARGQQVLRGGLANEGRKAPRPFGTRQAQLWIAGHDVAFAQRKTTLRQALVDVLRQWQQTAADFSGVSGIAGLENDAVVLIGVQGLFAPAFTAKAQPTERHTGIAFFRNRQFDYPADGVIVEQGNDLGDLR